jgi:hypothetical protein
MKIKDIKRVKIDNMLGYMKIFQIDKIDKSDYTKLLVFEEDGEVKGMINYLIMPSIGRYDKLIIKNINYIDIKYLDKMVKELCEYVKNNKLIIMIYMNNEIGDECKEIMKQNNFEGSDIIIYKY